MLITNHDVGDYLYPSDNPFDIPCLLADGQAGALELPVAPGWLGLQGIEGSTIEAEDVAICRGKGLKCARLDFIGGEPPRAVLRAGASGRLVVMMNPPFGNGAVTAFLERAWEIGAVGIGLFSKLDLLQGQSCRAFRERHRLLSRVRNAFIAPAKSFGCRGEWPVLFCVIVP